MKLLDREEEEGYCKFMDSIAVVVLRETIRNMGAIDNGQPDFNPLDSAEAIGFATGQIAYDKVIELTKEMSQETILRYFTETSMQMVVHALNENPGYFRRISLLGMLP